MTSSKTPKRPSAKVLDELASHDAGWDIDKHLKGCLSAYQQNPSYGIAVYFALEAISGIGREGLLMAESGKLPQEIRDSQWGMAPTNNVDVPWIWVRTLAEAWERYKDGDEELGKAFGLEGGQGKSPVSKTLETALDQRAIATWIWNRYQKGKAGNRKYRMEEAIGDASEHFDLSLDRTRTIWKLNGRYVRGEFRVATSPKSRSRRTF